MKKWRKNLFFRFFLETSGLSEPDFVRDVLVNETAAIVWEAVASYNYRYSFGAFLTNETSTDYYTGHLPQHPLVWPLYQLFGKQVRRQVEQFRHGYPQYAYQERVIASVTCSGRRPERMPA